MKSILITTAALLSISSLASTIEPTVTSAATVTSEETYNKVISSDNQTSPSLQQSSSADDEYVGMQIISSENNIHQSVGGLGVSLYAVRRRTTTQILSKKAVREIYHNMQRVTNIYSNLSTALGFLRPVIGAAMAISVNQNPKFRSAITKAYYQKNV